MVIHLILGQRVPLLARYPYKYIGTRSYIEIWVDAPINRVVTDKGWYESPF